MDYEGKKENEMNMNENYDACPSKIHIEQCTKEIEILHGRIRDRFVEHKEIHEREERDMQENIKAIDELKGLIMKVGGWIIGIIGVGFVSLVVYVFFDKLS
jgi:hypothetical protein